MTNPILRSLELAAARAEELTPLIYARLHREHPETQAMFRTEGSDLVKESMLVVRFQHSHPFAATTSKY
jgi:hypothetical protein